MFDNLTDFKNKLKNKNVGILGLGISNICVLKEILKIDCKIVLRDKNPITKNITALIEGHNVKIITGENYLSDIYEDYLFRSPGIMSTQPSIQEAIKRTTVLTSEIEAFFDMCEGKIIGVTGSDGKTTTTTIIYEILKKAGYNCFIGGNIGTPLFSQLSDIKKDDIVVAELSSFQLMTMKKSPYTAVITNIAPNHLDHHTDMNEYILAKTNIFKNGAVKVVLNAENDITKTFIDDNSVTFSLKNKQKQGAYLKNDKIYFNDTYIMDKNDIVLPGLHNVDNYLAAICAVSDLCDLKYVRTVAKTFGGVEHRIEFIRELNHIKYYNDSIASSPTRAIACLNSFDQKIIMIAGGSDKNIPFDALAKEIIKKVKFLVVMGATKDKIKNAVLKQDENFPIYDATNLIDAVNYCKDNSQSKDIVILCPACASFDSFKNFADRGNQFKKAVNEL